MTEELLHLRGAEIDGSGKSNISYDLVPFSAQHQELDHGLRYIICVAYEMALLDTLIHKVLRLRCLDYQGPRSSHANPQLLMEYCHLNEFDSRT
jgi:hypothetical protein